MLNALQIQEISNDSRNEFGKPVDDYFGFGVWYKGLIAIVKDTTPGYETERWWRAGNNPNHWNRINNPIIIQEGLSDLSMSNEGEDGDIVIQVII